MNRMLLRSFLNLSLNNLRTDLNPMITKRLLTNESSIIRSFDMIQKDPLFQRYALLKELNTEYNIKALPAYHKFVQLEMKNEKDRSHVSNRIKTLGLKWQEMNPVVRRHYEQMSELEQLEEYNSYKKNLEDFITYISPIQFKEFEAAFNSKNYIPTYQKIKEKNEAKERKKQCILHNKPRRPFTAIQFFISGSREKKYMKKDTVGKIQVFLRERFAALPESERKTYQKESADRFKQYHIDLINWNFKMILEEKEHLLDSSIYLKNMKTKLYIKQEKDQRKYNKHNVQTGIKNRILDKVFTPVK